MNHYNLIRKLITAFTWRNPKRPKFFNSPSFYSSSSINIRQNSILMVSDILNQRKDGKENNNSNLICYSFPFSLEIWTSIASLNIFFLIFRSPVNGESQDAVMHSDGKGQIGVLLFYDLRFRSLIILLIVLLGNWSLIPI